MKKRIFRMISLALILALCLGLCPVAGAAEIASGTCGENLTWTLNDEGELRISGTGAMTDYSDLQKYGYAPWYYHRGINSVVVEEGVTHIGSYAFYERNSLYGSVTLPSTLTSIGKGAFYGCKPLRQITIPAGVTSIGSVAFRNCTSLAKIDLPAGLTTLGDNAFWECTSLTQIDIPAGVTSIDQQTFINCTGLTRIDLPAGLTSIGYGAFYNCTSLAQIDLPAGVTSIDYKAFYNCTSLTQIDIPAGVTSIEWQTFIGCTNLSQVTIPDGVTTIGDGAFSGCTSLTQIDLPEKLTYIGSYAFEGCTGLTQIDLPEELTHIGGDAFTDCTGLTEIDLPKNLRSIYQTAFRNLTLDRINLPVSLISTWNSGSAFEGCTIKSVEIEEGRKEIIFGLLYGLDMPDLTLPKSVEEIQRDAIQSDTLSRLSIAGDVKRIEAEAIDCPNLSSIIFYGAAPEYMPENACGDDRSGITLWYSAGEPGWTTPTWNGWNTKPFRGGLFLSEARYNDGTMFDHYIKDSETGLGVPEAKVTTDIGDVLYTDQEGRVALPAAISYMAVEKEGYETITHRSFEEEADPSQAQLFGRGGSHRGKETTTIQRGGANPSLKSVTAYVTYVNGKKEPPREVLNSTWSVERNKIQSLELVIIPNDGNKDRIYSYALAEVTARGTESPLKEEEGSATVSDLTARSATMQVRAQGCATGRTLRVQLRGLSAGGYTNPVLASQNIGLKLVDAPAEAALTGDSVALPDLGAGGTVNEAVPFLGGKKLELKLPKIPVKVERETEGGKTKYKVEIGIAKTDDPNGDPKLWKNWKNAVDGLVTKGNAAVSGDKAKSFLNALNKASGGKFGGRDWKLVGGADPMEVKVAGYLEGESGSNKLTGKIAVIVKAETSMGTNITVMGVPVVLDATLTGELGTAGQLTGTFSNSGVELQFDGLTVTLELSLELFAGVGVKDVLNAGGYGKGGTELKMVFNKTQSFLDTWKLQGEWGVKGQILCFSAEIKLGSGEYWIYDKNNGQWNANAYHKNAASAQLLAEALLTDENSYTVAPRDYLRDYGQDEERAELFAQQMSSVRSLESSTYPDLQTRVVSAGGTTMMVYLKDPGQTVRPVDQDRTQLVYRTYNGSSWSQAKEVASAQVADFAPVLYAGEDGTIYAAWLRAKDSMADVTDMATAAGMTEVWVARYDPAQSAFVDACQVTDNDRYESQLALTAEGGALCLYWVENTANDVFGREGSNVIRRAEQSGSGWTVSELATPQGAVTTLRTGGLGGQAAVAWVEDVDRDLSTREDQYLRLWTGGAPVAEYAQGQVAGSAVWFAARLPGETGSALLWYSPEGLRYITAADGERKTLLEADKGKVQPWEVAASGDGAKLFFLYSQETQGQEGSDLYAMTYDADKGAWGEPVAVTQLGAKTYFERPTCAFVGGSQDLVVAFQRVNVPDLTTMESRTDLCWLSVKEVAELEIVSAACYDTGLTPGGEATLTVTLRNAGTVASTATAFTVSGSASAQASELQIPAIGSGETVTLEIPVTLADQLQSSSKATLRVADQGQASANIPLGLADLSLSAEQYVIAGRNMIFLEVTNQGYTAASGQVNVTDVGAGLHVDSRGFTALGPGQTAQFKMETDESFWSGDAQSCDLDIRLECEQAQQGNYNDNVVMTITRYSAPESVWRELKATAAGTLTGALRSREGQSLSGILMCAAYDADGRQLGVMVKPVDLRDGAEESIHWAQPGAARFKVFLLDTAGGTVKPYLMETVIPR